MKKTTAKEKNNKVRKIEDLAETSVDLEENSTDENHEVSELDPDVLKVLVKPRKSKSTVDATDYIPELERGDMDEDSGSAPNEY